MPSAFSQRAPLLLICLGLAATLGACTHSGDDTGSGSTGTGTGTTGLDTNFGVTETEGDAACENLLLTHCALPFPSDRFAVDGHLEFGEAFPETVAGVRMSDDFFTSVDGYGPATPILIQWPGATLSGLPQVFQPEQSLEDGAATVLLDADTGQRIAHWAETDYLTADQVDPVIILRPAVPLPEGHRVVVAIRGLQDSSGNLLPATHGFAALRDQTASTVVGLQDRRDHFEADIFPVLETAGFERANLQLAWDFTVSTNENAVADLRAVRDRLYEALGDDGPSYVIDSIEADPDSNIAVIATGHVDVPSFLAPPDDHGVRILNRDADGLPVAGDTESWEFTLQIPHSVWEGDGSGGVLQYGHGFMGSLREANNGWTRQLAQNHGVVILATNFQGMDEDTELVWTLSLTDDPGAFPWFAENAMQGIANQLALQRMMKTSFLLETDPQLSHDGVPVYDPDKLWYYGNSQGGTMGSLMMALSNDTARGVLGVPGADYAFLLHRSVDFTSMAYLFENLFSTTTDISLLLATLGTGFNRVEPLAFAPHIVDDPLAGTINHQVLLHVAKEDAQVQNQVSFVLGRAVGATLPTPAVADVWDLPQADYPLTGGASLVEFDFGIADDPTPMDPPVEKTDTHGWLRKLAEGQTQMMTFLETGEVIDVCDGQVCLFDGEPQ